MKGRDRRPPIGEPPDRYGRAFASSIELGRLYRHREHYDLDDNLEVTSCGFCRALVRLPLVLPDGSFGLAEALFQLFAMHRS